MPTAMPTLEDRIADAEFAFHNLQLGRHAVRVKIEGEETEFNRVSMPVLAAYIQKLKAERDGLVGGLSGAIGIVF